VGKIAKKSLKECVLVDSALKIQYHIVKNALLQTSFIGFLIRNTVGSLSQ